MGNLPQRIALVYDRVTKWGGAEQVLLALHGLFPQAPLYTAVYNPQTAPWARVFPQIHSTFIQRFPFGPSTHELYAWATPLAFENFDFSSYEAVISVTSSDAKGILTKPSTFHLCYCLTPTRYLYSHSVVPWPVSRYLTTWDQIASTRPDAYVAVSKTVQDRISKYYHQSSLVVYPPANLQGLTPSSPGDYFLSVSRLVYHKQPDLLVRLFNELQLPLVIAGVGRMAEYLRRIAKPNIKLLGFADRQELTTLYRNAKAYVSVHEEDFGLVYTEAQSAGLPILALNKGGVGEIVWHGKTGFLAQNLDELRQAISMFKPQDYDPALAHITAQRFSKERFQEEFVKVFKLEWTKYKTTSMS